MKKQRFNWMLAAILTICGATMALTSCKDDEVVPETTSTGVEQAETPTADALNVTTDKSYVMYGEWDEEFGHALGRRLKGTMTSPSNADVFVIDPTTIKDMNIHDHDLMTMIRRVESGEASVTLAKPTFREFYDWAQLYVKGYLLIEQGHYQGDQLYDSPQAAPARRKMANMLRNAYMAGQTLTAETRSTVNGMELNWEHVDQWPTEKQNVVMCDGFAQCGGNELYVMNAAATLNANAVVRHPQNDHEWGHKADAVAHWLNRQDAEKARTHGGLKRFAQAVTRAGDNANISDLMSAQTMDFVFDYQQPGQGEPIVCTRHSAIKAQYRAYSAYDFAGNVEYYQVRQNITAMNDQIYGDPGNNWYVRSNDGDYTLARGAWMKRIDTKIWLEGSGTKSIVSAGPLNENGSSSGSSSSGGGTTHTEGGSDGYSIGGSAGMSGLNPTFSVSGSYSHTDTYSDATSTTWNTTTNWSTKDLTTVCTQGSDANGTVTWKHTGNSPTTIDGSTGTHSNNIKQLLKSTCVTDEQVLWKVDNPSGFYTLKAGFNVVSEICKIKWNGSSYDGAFVPQDNPHEICFDLNAPDRFKSKWNNYVINYGSVQGDPILTGALDDYLEKTYGVSSGNNCWAGLFISTEATADGSANARAVFQTFKNSIRGLKQTMKSKGYGGTLVFGLKRDTEDEANPVDKLVLDLNATYEEGETLTEQVNGYDLTFKVTKKNVEVELSNVPNDFSGELVIPANIQDNALTVTSLGNNSAVRRKGITSVTIPSTIKTIQNGALAELNITTITVPEGVTDISTWAFHADTELTKVYLPSTLKSIDYSAFRDMDKLAEVHIKATTPPTLGDFLFYPRYDDAVLYVPKGYKQDYANAKEWWYFKNIVEE